MLAAEGMANSHIAEDLELSPPTVRAWRERFGSEGLAKLGEVRAGRGRKPSISDDKVAEIVNLTLHSKPDALVALAMLDLGGMCPPLPGRAIT